MAEAVLAQAAPPAAEASAPAAAPVPDGMTRRVTMDPSERRVVDLQPGDRIEIDARAEQLTYRRTADGLLIVSSSGGEALLRGADGQGSSTQIVVDGVASPVLDVIASALQDVAPAAGEPGGAPPAPTGPLVLASGLGAFGDLQVNPLQGLVDTGPLGFSTPRRAASEAELRPLRTDLDGTGAAGGGAGGPDGAASADMVLSVAGATGIETDAPVTLAFAMGIAVSDTDGPPAETLQQLTITFTTSPPPGTAFSAGTLTGNVLVLDIADFADQSALVAAITSLTATLPADWAGAMDGSAQATSTEGLSAAVPFSMSIVPTPDVTASGAGIAGTQSPTAQTLAIGIVATITDASFGAPETLERVTISFTGLPSGASFSAGMLAGGTLVFDVATFGGDPATLQAALATLTMTLPAGFAGSIGASIVPESTEGVGPASGFTVDIAAVPFLLPVASATPATAGEDLPSGAVALAVTLTAASGASASWVEISGVPAGVTFSVGTIVAPGVVRVEAADLGSLTLTGLPANSDADLALTLIPVSVVGGAPVAGAPAALAVTVDAVADLPDLSAPATLSVAEDTAIALSIAAVPADGDGSEKISAITITGVPTGAQLVSGGAALTPSGGVYTLTLAQLAGLSLVPAPHASGDFTLVIGATASETPTDGETDLANNAATVTTSLAVSVAPVADAPTLLVTSPARGAEDSFIALSIASALVDADGSETLSIRLDGLPPGSVLRSGTTILAPSASGPGGDSYVLAPAQLVDLAVRPPPDSNIDFVVGVTATAVETANGDSGQRFATLAVDVVGVSDNADLRAAALVSESVVDAAGGRVPLDIVATPRDADAAAGRPNSESVVAVVIAGVPAGLALSRGVVTAIAADGSTTWTLRKLDAGNEWDAVDLLGWSRDLAGRVDLTATAITTEDDGDRATTTIAFPVVVTPALDVFTPSGSATGDEDARIPVVIAAGIGDRDGSERLLGPVTLAQVPADVVLRVGETVLVPVSIVGGLATYRVAEGDLGTLTLQGPRDSNRDFDISVTLTVAEVDGVGDPVPGQSRTESFMLPVVIDGVADVPLTEIHKIGGFAGRPIGAEFKGDLADADGSERLYFVIADVPPGMGLQLGADAPAGAVLRALGDGRWIASGVEEGGLQVITAPDFASGGKRVVTLRVSAVSQEDDGGLDTAIVEHRVEVTIRPGTGGAGPDPGGPGTTPVLALVGVPGGVEDAPLPFALSLANVPAGATATIVVSQASLPAGTQLAGVPAAALLVDPASGDWTLSGDPALLAGLILLPPEGFSGVFSPVITAVVVEADGRIGRATIMPAVEILPVADPVTGSVSGSGVEDGRIKLDFVVLPGDPDGSETITGLTIAGLPAGAVLTNGAGIVIPGSGGSHPIVDPTDVFLQPPADLDGLLAFDLSVTTADGAAGLPGATATTTIAGSVMIAARADADTIAGPDMLFDGALSAITITPIDTDGSEATGVVLAVTGAPAGVDPRDVRPSAGIDLGDGRWALTIDQFAGAMLTLPPGAAGDVAFRVSVTSVERSNGDVASTVRDFTLRLGPAAAGADPLLDSMAPELVFDGLQAATIERAAPAGDTLQIDDLLPDLARTAPLELPVLPGVSSGAVDQDGDGAQSPGTPPAGEAWQGVVAGTGVEGHALLAAIQEQAATQLRGQIDHA